MVFSPGKFHFSFIPLLGFIFPSQVMKKSSAGIFSKYSKLLSVSKLLNTPPDGLGIISSIPELRVDLKDSWQFTAIYDKPQLSYEHRVDSYNILLIGPTGTSLLSPTRSLSPRKYKPNILLFFICFYFFCILNKSLCRL